MSVLKPIYSVFRGIIISLILLIIVVYVGLYVLLSIPSFQEKVKTIVCDETSALLGGTIEIDRLSIRPFSEVLLTGVSLSSPEGEKCIGIGKVAAGIDLWTLFFDRKIVLNYAEIIGMDVKVEQKIDKGPLNIQFLIDALSPKNKDKPSTIFDLKMRNIVVRDSKARFLRSWMIDEDGKSLPFAEVNLDKLRIDLSIPVLKNDFYRFDIRNMQFDVDPGVSVRSLTGDISYAKDTTDSSSDRIVIKDLNIGFPNSTLAVGDMDLRVGSLSDLDVALTGNITPSDFSQLVPSLKAFDTSWDIDIGASLHDNGIDVSSFSLRNQDLSSSLSLNGDVENYRKRDSINVHVNDFHADLAGSLISDIGASLTGASEKIRRLMMRFGRLRLDMDAHVANGDQAGATGVLTTDHGMLDFDVDASALKTRRPIIKFEAEGENLELGNLLETDKVGSASFSLTGDVAGLDRNAEGNVALTSDALEIMGKRLTDLELNVEKKKEDIDLSLHTSAEEMALDMETFCHLEGKDTEFQTDVTLSGFNPSQFGLKGKLSDCLVSTRLQAHTFGNNADNITGQLRLTDLSVSRPGEKKLRLSELKVDVDSLAQSDFGNRYEFGRLLTLSSDWLDARIEGDFSPINIGKEMKRMLSSVFPTLIASDALAEPLQSLNDFNFDVNIKGVAAPYKFLDTPVRPLSDFPIAGAIDARHGKMDVKFNTPHLLQGKNKLISDIDFSMTVDSFLGMAKLNAGAIYPTKKGDVQLASDIYAVHDKVNVNLGLNPTMKSSVKGGLALEASFFKLPDPINPKGNLAVHLEILPSTITVSGMPWSIANGMIDYCQKRVSVNNFLISHEGQYVKIDGVASESPDEYVKVKLNDIDLEYIFNILNINYVAFGGMATGEVVGRMLLTKRPEAHTEYLRVKDLSYNGAVMGNGELASEYDADQQKVGIYAVIRDPLTRQRRANIDGGIWVTRDSLSFNMDADKVNVELMKPFVSAFCSDLNGTASGKCTLYGTFSDIDLVGALKADTLSMKLDFTNTWYHAGRDSVFLHKGVIEIPPLTLYDDEGHTAEFSGWLRHRYFHEPSFNFRVRDARSLLVYDTNEKINPLWYGTIYGSGHAQINGYPGLIEIDMNMTTEDNSKFYYVISDTEEVEQYSFLSFTDKRKASRESVVADTVPEYLSQFIKQNNVEDASSSNVVLSLKGTVTNDALVTLVMDPKAGDNITARGQGALQMDYNMASNDLRMIGTYVLDEGNYNFTLQDIIIKNFNIKKGSQITFDGDPMNANLDITATYRVNTNLTDLDKSFSTDRELNRTNVPVDALLMVKGPMTHPDISFDIELPSLTSDVERKVKSIVSTNDMMNRQIIYLLALNRFYTPEYTDSGETTSGSEWSSMASSTISSQLSNILSQMTDKLDMAPSFRSDKGDFTDLEFDLALSSRLLNNRLLINGNFGYRDRATSNTQFVGDFDIEYLLSKNGNLRLKAYNHFNDQNYYLRSALTTQGVGVVFRKDFDRLFRRKRKDGGAVVESKVDSIENAARERKELDKTVEKDSIK